MNSKNECFGIRNVHSILKIFWNVQPVCFRFGFSVGRRYAVVDSGALRGCHAHHRRVLGP